MSLASARACRPAGGYARELAGSIRKGRDEEAMADEWNNKSPSSIGDCGDGCMNAYESGQMNVTENKVDDD